MSDEDRIRDHRAFLAKITATHRDNVMDMVEPRAWLAVTEELEALIRSAQDEGAFAQRCPLPEDNA